jgi:hypothetical protein
MPANNLVLVNDVLAHYESQTEEDAVMEIPTELVPKVRELIAKHKVA